MDVNECVHGLSPIFVIRSLPSLKRYRFVTGSGALIPHRHTYRNVINWFY